MNFRNFRYFLTVCEMGTINAAARKLFISQQSLSENIKNLEKEVGIQLFYREKPMVLTEAGRCFRQAAIDMLERMDRLEQDLQQLKGAQLSELTIGMVDYGTPEFMIPLMEEFIKQEPNVIITPREIGAGSDLPAGIPLFITARELGGDYRSEILIWDRPVICVSDALLQKCYGDKWEEHKRRLEEGDVSALKGCPFMRHRNTPLEAISEKVMAANHFEPDYLPIVASTHAIMQFCRNGKAAAVTLEQIAGSEIKDSPCYVSAHAQEKIPCGFICYRNNTVLNEEAKKFLETTKRYFARRELR